MWSVGVAAECEGVQSQESSMKLPLNAKVEETLIEGMLDSFARQISTVDSRLAPNKFLFFRGFKTTDRRQQIAATSHVPSPSSLPSRSPDND